MIRIASLALPALLFVSCGGAETAEKPPAATTSSAPAPAPAAPASTPSAAPETLVSELYRRHDASESPFFQTESRARVDAFFEPSLAELIWKDAVESKGEVGALGFDPLYNAQDTDIKNLVVEPAQSGAGRATVVVRFENYNTPERITYTLVPAAGAWRISDIAYAEENATLRGVLSGPK